jgi:hypothetical protein
MATSPPSPREEDARLEELLPRLAALEAEVAALKKQKLERWFAALVKTVPPKPTIAERIEREIANVRRHYAAIEAKLAESPPPDAPRDPTEAYRWELDVAKVRESDADEFCRLSGELWDKWKPLLDLHDEILRLEGTKPK